MDSNIFKCMGGSNIAALQSGFIGLHQFQNIEQVTSAVRKPSDSNMGRTLFGSQLRTECLLSVS